MWRFADDSRVTPKYRGSERRVVLLNHSRGNLMSSVCEVKAEVHFWESVLLNRNPFERITNRMINIQVFRKQIKFVIEQVEQTG